MPLQQKEFSDTGPHQLPNITKPVPSSPWYSVGPGIWELLLNGETDSDHKSVLQWYQPGAVSVTDEIITHSYTEEVIFLEGGLEDVTLRQEWSKGAYAYRNPGMKHGPYRASEKGCLQFVKLVPP